MDRNDPAIRWLLNSDDPSVRYLTLTELLDVSLLSRAAQAAKKQILDGPRVSGLLAGQGRGQRRSQVSLARHRGGFGVHWHYDFLQGLLILARAGKLNDPRADEALDLVESKRCPDGTWHAEGCYWKPRGKARSNVEVVDWGRSGPNEMITSNALRVLKRAGRTWYPLG